MNWALDSVLVTGAGSGLGREVAVQIAQKRVHVFCLDVVQKGLDETLTRIDHAGGSAEALVCDVADERAVAAAFAAVKQSYRALDGIVTCAGITSQTSILDLTLAEWERCLAVNLRGTFLCVQAALRLMIPRNTGRVVTIGSDVGTRGGGRLAKSAYGAAKGGVIVFTKSIARELAAMKLAIRVNCACPGPMQTAMNADMSDDVRRMVESSVPVGRIGAPQEVAAAVLFLLSDEASYVYGETFNVDGGVVMD
jgi:NAD(P)-dependent dehydrogenase (short-subunit alcohol dehydrogenase family)